MRTGFFLPSTMDMQMVDIFCLPISWCPFDREVYALIYMPWKIEQLKRDPRSVSMLHYSDGELHERHQVFLALRIRSLKMGGAWGNSKQGVKEWEGTEGKGAPSHVQAKYIGFFCRSESYRVSDFRSSAFSLCVRFHLIHFVSFALQVSC